MTLVFFTDRDLGTAFPEILKSAGLTVERHRDHFAPDCSDEDWLAEVGRRGWVALTRDARIRYKPNELAAVIRHRVRLLVIVGKAPFPDLATSFVATQSRLEAFRRWLAATGCRQGLSSHAGATSREPGRRRPDRTVVPEVGWCRTENRG